MAGIKLRKTLPTLVPGRLRPFHPQGEGLPGFCKIPCIAWSWPSSRHQAIEAGFGIQDKPRPSFHSQMDSRPEPRPPASCSRDARRPLGSRWARAGGAAASAPQRTDSMLVPAVDRSLPKFIDYASQ